MRLNKVMRIKTIATLLTMIAVLWGASAISQEKSGFQEQVQFSAEDETVKHPISVPEEAWSILKRDPSVLEVLTDRNLTIDQLPASWFTASEVHLGGPDEGDVVVVGKGPLRGANVTTFWVFLRRPQGLKLALTVPAHDLIIKPVRRNGYKGIEIVSATAVKLSRVSYRFDGSQYRVNERSTQDIR
jgi:hypothetical protein